jgi:dTDP-4-amino-4,6-dideoxygalactose transaminase
MKNFGFAGNDNVICIGTNGKMTEVSAAMGITSLESLEEIIAVNYLNYKQYKQELASIPGVRMAVFDETEKSNYQYIVLEIDETITGITRDDILRILVAENVLARRYFYPGCHRMEPYRSYFPQAGLSLPVTERLANRVLCLPTGQVVGRMEIETICEIIRISTTNAEEINMRFAGVTPSR